MEKQNYNIEEVAGGVPVKMWTRGVPVEDETLKDLPAMTSADYEKLGDTYLGRAQAGLASAKYQKALELDPRSWRLEYKIGTILLRQGAPAEALPYFRSIISRDPNNAFGYEGEGRTLLALGEHDGDRHDDAPHLVIAPQTMRAPALPSGSVFMSSAAA